MLENARPVHAGAEELAFEEDPACARIHGIEQRVLLTTMRRSAVDGEEGHARPEGRRDGLLHPGDICLVDPRVQEADEVIIQECHGRELLLL